MNEQVNKNKYQIKALKKDFQRRMTNNSKEHEEVKKESREGVNRLETAIKNLSKEVNDLKENYVVFKTKLVVYVAIGGFILGIAGSVISALLINKLI